MRSWEQIKKIEMILHWKMKRLRMYGDDLFFIANTFSFSFYSQLRILYARLKAGLKSEHELASEYHV